MKRFFTLFLSLLIFVGCESDTNNNNNIDKPQTPTDKEIISLPGKSSISLSKSGKQSDLTFIAYFDWSIEVRNLTSGVAPSHITVSKTSGTKGMQTIAISAAENTTGKDITADIVFVANNTEKKIPFRQITTEFITVEDAKLQSVIVAAFDTDKDGEITQQEADAIEVLECCGKGKSHINIFSLKGIEQFKNLRQLDCSLAQLTELDLSQSPKIDRLICHSNYIRTLDLAPLTGLTELDASSNNLRKLDLSKNTLLESIKCSDNFITEMQINNLTKLRTLHCEYNKLTDIELSNCTELTYISVNDNYNIAQLDISNCTKLTKLICDYNKISTLDVTKNTQLITLICGSNPLSSLNVSNCAKLQFISASSTSLTELDTSKCPDLQLIYIFSNKSLAKLYIKKDNSISDIIYDKGLLIIEV